MNSQIVGLKYGERFFVQNNQANTSCVVPFPTTLPVNIVYHGQTKFDYGHYGIHVGQEDILTFLGDERTEFEAWFIDCRADSATRGVFEKHVLRPSSKRTLTIPPGVAHTFFNLEGIHTINQYKLYLPEVDEMLGGKSQWRLTTDVINIPLDINTSDLPIVNENKHVAADQFYRFIETIKRSHTSTEATVHPIVIDSKELGKKIILKEKLKQKNHVMDPIEPVPGIFGLHWKRNEVVHTGEHSGIVHNADIAPFYIVDHGHDSYTHDSYGVHLGQEDNLTFLGGPDKLVKVKFLDLRENSATQLNYIEQSFAPSALRTLIIPPGVAHAFEGLEDVFTLNRPRLFLDHRKEYVPGVDVIDIPFDLKRHSLFKVNRLPATMAFYENMSQKQQEIAASKRPISSPITHMIEDTATGKKYRVSLRRKLVG